MLTAELHAKMEPHAETFQQHRADCIAAQAWDMPEAEAQCSCEFPYPMRVCVHCFNRPHQHKRDCPRRG